MEATIQGLGFRGFLGFRGSGIRGMGLQGFRGVELRDMGV